MILPRQPAADDVKRELLKVLETTKEAPYVRLVHHIKHKDVDVSWLLSMLQLVNPMNAMLQENYLVPNKRKKVDEVKEAERQRRENICEVYLNAFDNLPMPPRS